MLLHFRIRLISSVSFVDRVQDPVNKSFFFLNLNNFFQKLTNLSKENKFVQKTTFAQAFWSHGPSINFSANVKTGPDFQLLWNIIVQAIITLIIDGAHENQVYTTILKTGNGYFVFKIEMQIVNPLKFWKTNEKINILICLNFKNCFIFVSIRLRI